MPRNTRGKRLCYRHLTKIGCFGVCCLGGPAKRVGHRRENLSFGFTTHVRAGMERTISGKSHLTVDIILNLRRSELSFREIAINSASPEIPMLWSRRMCDEASRQQQLNYKARQF